MKSCQATKILSPQEQINLVSGSRWTLTRSCYIIWLMFKELPQIFARHHKGSLLHLLRQNHANKHFSSRSLMQKRLSIYNWNPGPWRGKEDAFEKQIAGRWHAITLQEASEYVEHDILTGRFDWSNTWSKQGEHDRHISLKKRPAACSRGHQKRRISEVMSDHSLSS